MKYFICAMDEVYLGIPADKTERVIPANRAQSSVYETENEEAFISVPILLKLKSKTAAHGIVLKKSKTVLLVPKIDIDMEIPEDKIFALPEALSGLSAYFRGACFTVDCKLWPGKDQNVILILDPDKLCCDLRG